MALSLIAGCFVSPRCALSAEQVHDEIQVYNGEIAAVGQWTIEQHLNYAWRGQTTPDFPGALTSNHSLQGTPEFAYGITDWWEAGFYLPFAISNSGQALSDGVKVRNLFVIPDAAKHNFFYGVNFELSYETPSFAQAPWGLEVRPIVGVRNTNWEYIVNPIINFSFGTGGEADFAPAVRLARKIGEDRYIGVEYYGDFGQIGNFLPLSQTSQVVFAVADFKLEPLDIELGIGFGLTPGSDGLITKAIIGYAFPVPGGSNESVSISHIRPFVPKAFASQTAAPWSGLYNSSMTGN